jgi:hypothetical protein
MQNPPSPTKPLVEGIISLVLSAESLAFPLVSGILAATYKEMAAGNATCRSGTEEAHACTAQEIETARTLTYSVLVTVIVVACFILAAAIVLGILAHQHALQTEGTGKAKAGNILGMIGWILGVVLLIITIVLTIVGLTVVK